MNRENANHIIGRLEVHIEDMDTALKAEGRGVQAKSISSETAKTLKTKALMIAAEATVMAEKLANVLEDGEEKILNEGELTEDL